MADTATQTLMERHKAEAETRRAELLPAVEEFNQIEEYLSAFGGSSRRRSPARSRNGSGGSRRSRSGVNRHDQFLAIVEKEPGLTISKIAERINEHLGEGERPVSSNYLYRVRDALLEEGKIEADGDGFKAVKAAKS